MYAGEADGIADLERSVELARGSNAGALARVVNSLAVAYQVVGDLELAYRTRLESLRSAERSAPSPCSAGSRECSPTITTAAASGTRRFRWQTIFSAASKRVRRRSPRGRPTRSGRRCDSLGATSRAPIADADAALASGREIDEVQAVCFALAAGAHVFAVAGEPSRATELAGELLDSLRGGVGMQFAIINLPLLAAAARRLGLGDELRAALDGHTRLAVARLRARLPRRGLRHRSRHPRADRSEARRAEARLRAAEQLVAEGRASEADAQLERALAFYRSVRATAAVRELERR